MLYITIILIKQKGVLHIKIVMLKILYEQQNKMTHDVFLAHVKEFNEFGKYFVNQTHILVLAALHKRKYVFMQI